MTRDQAASRDQATPRVAAATSRRRGSNGADLRYLEEARSALEAIMPISDAARRSAASPQVRALASDALVVQTSQLEAIALGLLGWGRQVANPLDAREPSEPEQEAGEVVYAAALAAHAHASIASARAEMVSGLNPSTRAIAQDTIRAQSRQLSALGPTPSPV